LHLTLSAALGLGVGLGTGGCGQNDTTAAANKRGKTADRAKRGRGGKNAKNRKGKGKGKGKNAKNRKGNGKNAKNRKGKGKGKGKNKGNKNKNLNRGPLKITFKCVTGAPPAKLLPMPAPMKIDSDITCRLRYVKGKAPKSLEATIARVDKRGKKKPLAMGALHDGRMGTMLMANLTVGEDFKTCDKKPVTLAAEVLAGSDGASVFEQTITLEQSCDASAKTDKPAKEPAGKKTGKSKQPDL
jgi:hypothetical protein